MIITPIAVCGLVHLYGNNIVNTAVRTSIQLTTDSLFEFLAKEKTGEGRGQTLQWSCSSITCHQYHSLLFFEEIQGITVPTVKSWEGTSTRGSRLGDLLGEAVAGDARTCSVKPSVRPVRPAGRGPSPLKLTPAVPPPGPRASPSPGKTSSPPEP